MKINLPSGAYIREGVAGGGEPDWLWGVMKTWPKGGFNLSRCSGLLSKSESNYSDGMLASKETIIGLILIYCLADGTRVGAARVNHYAGAPSGFSVDFAVVDPAYRGAGHFTAMSEGIAHLANQHLEADEATYVVIDSAPQVLSRTLTMGGMEHNKVGDKTEVRYSKELTQAALTDAVKAMKVDVL